MEQEHWPAGSRGPVGCGAVLGPWAPRELPASGPDPDPDGWCSQPRPEASSCLQVKLLTKELAALREAGAQTAGALQDAQEAKAELEEQLQRAAWELRDLAAVKDARCGSLPPGPGTWPRRRLSTHTRFFSG